MTNATVSNAKLLETIQGLQKDIGVKIDNLTAKTNDLHTQFSVMSATVERVSEISEMSRRTLRGSNGDQGLVASVQEVKRRIDGIEGKERVCGIDDVKRVLNGNDKDPGLIERVRDLEELGTTIRKWTYLAGSAVLLGIISLAFDVIPRIILLINQGG